MTEEEIQAKKFAMESAKENAAEDAKEEARKQAKKSGKKFDEKAFDKKQKAQFSGRPAKIAGDEPAKDENGKDDSNRIAVNGKAAADSLMAIEKKKQEDSLWYKNEYVPVTSIIHTVKFDNYKRIYEADYRVTPSTTRPSTGT